jgi:hypothetical protein
MSFRVPSVDYCCFGIELGQLSDVFNGVYAAGSDYGYLVSTDSKKFLDKLYGLADFVLCSESDRD